ncbi:putative LysR family transcriptional regulator YafC [Pseudescherichia vulneris NBRC 102420]|uniref:Putative LysR family transcriptional regulator YafC n=1 Tax=Pseudescherichia vulneris NBRC 102420 TaxID=1115515 RepID=A0A090UZK2_PSEVU|nr:LysR family transcriptional regulator [Pseudescherichia vulneris]GAL58035.1 putative LysR family transcriptional regulator YafC [Pseudescherichia vulneris NBRC 102420]STQ60039.1 putative transcriptional regulator LYSR-type [Pseudescherichia vulneris]
MNLQNVSLFLVITETRSLTQAAKRQNISAMAVSRRLASLEHELGVRLVQRTTRSVSLTQEGMEFLPYARALIDAETGAKSLFSPSTQGAAGLLRITAPSGFGRRNILPLVPELLADNPKLNIDLQLSEDVVDIVGRGIDVAIRIAPLKDSTLIARKITDNPRVICASPAYLNSKDTPRFVEDLTTHHCLRLSSVPQWIFERDGEIIRVSVEGRFTSDNVEGVRELCVQGLGIAQLTRWDVRKEIQEGALVEIALADAEPQALSIWAVLPSTRYLPLRVSAFIEKLKSSLTSTN